MIKSITKIVIASVLSTQLHATGISDVLAEFKIPQTSSMSPTTKMVVPSIVPQVITGISATSFGILTIFTFYESFVDLNADGEMKGHFPEDARQCQHFVLGLITGTIAVASGVYTHKKRMARNKIIAHNKQVKLLQIQKA